jgi:DNA modification methylase
VKPYYDHGGITIYHGDSLEILDGLEVPLGSVVMDPPYASGARTEAKKNSSGAMLRGERWAAKPIENDQMTTIGFIWLMRHVLLEACDMLVDGGAVLSFIDWRQWPNLVGAVESVNLRVNGMVVWDKLSYGLGNGFRAQHELVLFASKGVPTIADKSTGNVLRHKRDDNDEHPSPKPIPLMAELLAVVGDGTVLDPFMGAGSTLLACKQLKKPAIGIELEEKYCEIAARRLSQEVFDFDRIANPSTKTP